jgi:hypothetical protein
MSYAGMPQHGTVHPPLLIAYTFCATPRPMACVWDRAGRGILQAHDWLYDVAPHVRRCPKMSVATHPLTPRHEQGITALLVQGGLQATAEASGVNEKTLRRWLRDDAVFQTAYREARRAVVQHAIVQVQRATGEAVATLRSVMQDANTPASARVSAAKAILDTAVKAVELEDLEARIAALEAQGQPQ